MEADALVVESLVGEWVGECSVLRLRRGGRCTVVRQVDGAPRAARGTFTFDAATRALRVAAAGAAAATFHVAALSVAGRTLRLTPEGGPEGGAAAAEGGPLLIAAGGELELHLVSTGESDSDSCGDSTGDPDLCVVGTKFTV